MNAKEAAEIAARNFSDLFADYGQYSDLRLEEVEKNDDEWLITLGYLDKAQEGFSLGLNKRRYKVFTIKSTGEVTSVKIRPMD
ncbi:hypothetical protein ACE41H_23690 [Paenibacillus enshidis]|uniref:PepSY domain-containing protein n=1 Tax=Paenibacillus enshidis TaxID=1458439 RepID=A0ABV5AZW0_9BACL